MHRELLPSQLSTEHTHGNSAHSFLDYRLPSLHMIKDGTRGNLYLKA